MTQRGVTLSTEDLIIIHIHKSDDNASGIHTDFDFHTSNTPAIVNNGRLFSSASEINNGKMINKRTNTRKMCSCINMQTYVSHTLQL